MAEEAVVDLEELDTPVDGGEETVVEDVEPSSNGTTKTVAETSRKEVSDFFKDAASNYPDKAKLITQLKDTYFRTTEGYKAAYATPAEAAAAKSLVEGIGGPEGIAAIQERISTYDAQDEALKNGDPAALDSFFKDFPEGAAALAPVYLSKLAAANPEAMVAAVGPYAIGLLENVNFSGYLQALVNETDPAKAKSIAQQLLTWYSKTAQGFAKTDNKPNAAQTQLTKDRESVAQEREKVFVDAVSTKVTATCTPVLGTEVDKYAKMYKLNDDQKKHYSKTLEETVVSEMNKDKGYQKQVDLRYAAKTRTHDTVSNYIAGEFNNRVKLKAFDVIKSIYGAAKGGTTTTKTGNGVVKPGGAMTAPGGAPIRISAKPPDDRIDMNHRDAAMDLILDRAHLKDGRYVTWKKLVN